MHTYFLDMNRFIMRKLIILFFMLTYYALFLKASNPPKSYGLGFRLRIEKIIQIIGLKS